MVTTELSVLVGHPFGSASRVPQHTHTHTHTHTDRCLGMRAHGANEHAGYIGPGVQATGYTGSTAYRLTAHTLQVIG